MLLFVLYELYRELKLGIVKLAIWWVRVFCKDKSSKGGTPYEADSFIIICCWVLFLMFEAFCLIICPSFVLSLLLSSIRFYYIYIVIIDTLNSCVSFKFWQHSHYKILEHLIIKIAVRQYILVLKMRLNVS